MVVALCGFTPTVLESSLVFPGMEIVLMFLVMTSTLQAMLALLPLSTLHLQWILVEPPAPT
jgi:hypothetical protein